MDCSHAGDDETAFVDWLRISGSTVSPSIAIHSYTEKEMGRGVIALQDIEEDELLFSIPRTVLLTTQTSSLPSRLPAEEWSSLTGWTPLILCLMYEYLRPPPVSTASNSSSGSTAPVINWSAYFSLLPRRDEFNSLMFWSSAELSHLQGCRVVDKIGKDEAEKCWSEEIVPLVAQNAEIFGEEREYSLELFHWMGSVVLSRSFHVEDGTESDGEESDDDDDEEEEEEDEQEALSSIALIPLADLLNASPLSNARLFYSPLSLEMRSTSRIAAGEQVFNTYADPPSSDLLRRYGYVEENEGEGIGEGEIVEVGMEEVLKCLTKAETEERIEQAEGERRAEWLLEMGIDDTFSLTPSHLLPAEYISTIRTFLSTPAEFEKCVAKGSPPKAKMDAVVARWADEFLRLREAEYEHTIEDDETLFSSDASLALPYRHRMALLVRLREKRILRSARERLSVDWLVPAATVAAALASSALMGAAGSAHVEMDETTSASTNGTKRGVTSDRRKREREEKREDKRDRKGKRGRM